MESGRGRQAEEVAGDDLQGIVADGGEEAHEFGFGGLIGAAAGFDLHGGGAVTGHGVEEGAGAEFEALAGGGFEGAGGAFPVVGFDAGRREREMGVTIDEAGYDEAAGGVDFDGVARCGKVLDAARWPDFQEHAITDEHGAVLNNPEFVEGLPRRWSGASAKGEQAACSSDKNCAQFIS